MQGGHRRLVAKGLADLPMPGRDVSAVFHALGTIRVIASRETGGAVMRVAGTPRGAAARATA